MQNRIPVGSNPTLHSRATRYVILESTSIDKLVVEVNALLRLGWQPQGGVAKNETHYLQAMVHTGIL
ncbi:DUF1737 domain-containing protein [bacterium]|nr:DUF1737 domain-containing protein [bacterium]